MLLILSMRSGIAVPVTRWLVRVSVGSSQLRIESPQVVVVVLVGRVDRRVLIVVGRSREGVAIWVDHCGIIGYPCAWQRAMVSIVDGAVDGDRRRKAKEDAGDFESVGSSANRRSSIDVPYEETKPNHCLRKPTGTSAQVMAVPRRNCSKAGQPHDAE